MGSSDSDSSRSKDRHKDKAKRQKKIKKQKKEKKDKHSKKQKKDKKEKHKYRSRSKSRDKIKKEYDQQKLTTQNRMQSYEQKAIEKVYVPRTHIPCRRCEEQTFSLKLKQCSNCGYPKEQRPANFPVVKQIDVMELIRQGKMVHNSFAPVVIEIVVNDRMGRKQRIKCHPDQLVLDFKRLIAAQIGTRAEKIRLQKASIIFKDHLTLSDYEIKDGAGLEMYYD